MDIFNLNSDDFIAQSAKKVRASDENLYDPDPSTAKNGSYQAVVRLIPWFGAKSIDDIRYKKYGVSITNPLTKEKLFLDDPSTIGESSVFWNLETIIKGLEKSEPELFKQLNANFSRFYKFYSLAYIKKDPQKPELEGKIKVFPHGFKIWKMGEELINPTDSALGLNERVNPYDMVNGRDLILIVSKKSVNAKWRDFDSCRFHNVNSPLIVKTPKGAEVACTSDPVVQEKFKEFLEKNSPNLSNYFFKPWAETDYAKAVEFLRAAIPSKQILDQAFEKCREPKIKAAYEASFQKKSGSVAGAVPTTSLGDLEGDLTFGTSTKTTAKPATADVDFDQPASVTTAKTNVAIDDDMFADL